MSRDRRVFTGGAVLTMDGARPRGSAVVVEDGRVIEVRPPGAPAPEPMPGEERVDLNGRAVLPGFCDAHTHLLHWGLAMVRPNLGETRSLKEALERMAHHLEKDSSGGALIGEGWDESRWSHPVFPTRADLDRLSRERPVVMRRVCGHMAVANGAALALIPAGPEVEAESGLLVEDAAMGLARVFPPGDGELDAALAAAQRSYHAFGVTSVHDMSTPDHLRAYRRAERRNALKLRITAILQRPHLATLIDSGLGTGWRRGRLAIWGVKLFADGSLGARTAALHHPYADAPEERGRLLLAPEELTPMVAKAEAAGIPLAVHAIGDLAIDRVLDAFDAALPAGSRLGHRIEHLEMPGEAAIARMLRLGMTASMQPNFVANWGQPGGMYEARLGPRRLAAMNPMGRIVEMGIPLILGSDAMPAGVLPALAAAVEAPFAGQRLSPEAAIASATREAALAVGDREGGVLVEGARADLVVLDRDPTGPGQLKNAGVERVYAGGELVWERGLAESANASPGSG